MINNILTMQDAKKFNIKPAIYEGKIFGVRIYRGLKKVFPGTISITEIHPDVMDYIKSTYKWELPFKAMFHRD